MIKRKPSQEDLAYDNDLAEAEKAVPTDDVVDSDIIDIAGESDRTQAPSSNNRQSQAIGRMVAGAAPTLFGFLFGPQQSERAIAQTQKFYAAGKPSKLVPIVGENGDAIYETPEGAIGEKVYQKPTKMSQMSSGKWLPGKSWIKDANGVELLTDTLTNNASGEIVNAITKDPIKDGRSYVAAKTYLTEGLSGGKSASIIDPSLKDNAVMNREPLERGLGDFYGVKTKGQGQTIEKGFEEGQKQSQLLASSLVDVKSAKDTLITSKDPRAVAQAVYGMVRSVETKGVLTDQDFENITGSNMKSYIDNLKYKIDTKAFGDVEELRNSYMNLANEIEKKASNKLGALSRTYAPPTKQAQAGFKSVVPVRSKEQAIGDVKGAADWARRHPNDPKAKKILKILEAM